MKAIVITRNTSTREKSFKRGESATIGKDISEKDARALIAVRKAKEKEEPTKEKEHTRR